MSTTRPRNRRGLVLPLVLVVIAMLTLAGLTYSELMLAERRAALSAAQQAQARASADSGLEMVKLLLSKDPETLKAMGGWYDNPALLRGMLVCDHQRPERRSRFTVITPRYEPYSTASVRFGLEDESTKLNLNTLALADQYAEDGARRLLMGLPGMTEQIADAILDWIDEDDDPRENGAEIDYYASLVPGYAPRNGPLQTVEELLLVRDVWPEMLFGSDANRNGLPDANEPTEALLIQSEAFDESINRGWAAYLTLWSKETNLRPDGRKKIDLNQNDMQTLFDELTEAFPDQPYWALFIVLYRQNGPTTSEPTLDIPPELTQAIDLTRKPKAKLTTVLDLIDAKTAVTIPGENNKSRKVVLMSPFLSVPELMQVYLPLLMDHVAVNTSPEIIGRINVNQAPRAVLAGVPGMTTELLDRILSTREPDPAKAPENRRHETWLLEEGLVTLEQMKALLPFLCAGGCVYRAQVVGYFDRAGPAVRIEAVLDAAQKPPTILMWRDISHLGRGYALATLGIESWE